MKIIKAIVSIFSAKQLYSIFYCLIQFLTEYFSCKKVQAQNEKNKTEEKKTKKYMEKAKDVVENGTIEDLLNLGK